MMIRTLAAALFLLSYTAIADEPAVDDPTLAPAHCTQPPLPEPTASDNNGNASRIKRHNVEDLNAQITAYQNCMRAYVDMQGDLSRKHIAAANAAVKEVNDYGEKLNDAR